MIDYEKLSLSPFDDAIADELRIQAERVEASDKDLSEVLARRVDKLPTVAAQIEPMDATLGDAIAAAFPTTTMGAVGEADPTSAHGTDNHGRLRVLLVVDDDGLLQGIVTLEDIAQAIVRGLPWDTQLESIMSAAEVVHLGDTLADVLRWVVVRGFRQVPVVDAGGSPVGLIRVEDMVAELTASHELRTRPADPSRGAAPRYGG